MMRRLVALFTILLLTACATSPLGRSQLQLFGEERLAEMGAASYQQIKQETPTATSGGINDYVTCIARPITRLVGGDWEITVFESDQVNAFALPGGKIGVYAGLLDVAEDQDQLATVIAHEVAHVVAEHGNERVSTQYATQGGLAAISAFLGGGGGAGGQQIMALLGVGAQVGVLLPFSRTQESEADVVGLELMARAGFDPRASVALWQNMKAEGGASPPPFMSTHPSNENRIDTLRDYMPEALQLYQQTGQRPQCG